MYDRYDEFIVKWKAYPTSRFSASTKIEHHFWALTSSWVLTQTGLGRLLTDAKGLER